MTLQPQKHKFSEGDAEELQKIGYAIVHTGKHSFVAFMHENFPDFNLLALVKAVEHHFNQTTTAVIVRRINSDEDGKQLRLEYYNDFTKEDDALLFVRSFLKKAGQIEINHEYCVIPKASRGKGLIKPVFQESLQQYVNMNAAKILVHAGLSAGGYAWAKHGFVAVYKIEVDAILKVAEERLPANEFNVVKRIYEVYYHRNPVGKNFPIDLWAALDFMKPILAGSDWHGEVNLKNEEQFHNFMNYVFRQV